MKFKLKLSHFNINTVKYNDYKSRYNVQCLSIYKKRLQKMINLGCFKNFDQIPNFK